jgi:hypothetical protein
MAIHARSSERDAGISAVSMSRFLIDDVTPLLPMAPHASRGKVR